jgi:hypothetical protein
MATLPPPPPPPTVESFSLSSFVDRALAEPEAAQAPSQASGRGRSKPTPPRTTAKGNRESELVECDGCGTRNRRSLKKCPVCEAPLSAWGFGNKEEEVAASTRLHRSNSADSAAVSQWIDDVESGAEQGPRMSFPWSGDVSKVFMSSAQAGTIEEEAAVGAKGAVAMDSDALARAARSEGFSRSGRGVGLGAAPSTRGRGRSLRGEREVGGGGQRKRSNSGPSSANVTMEEWMEAAVQAEVAGRGKRGLEEAPRQGSGRGEREELRKNIMADWLSMAETGGRGRGNGIAAPGRGRAARDRLEAPAG